MFYCAHASSSRNSSDWLFVLIVGAWIGTSGNGPIFIISCLISSWANNSNSRSKSASLYKSDEPIGDEIALAISSAKRKKEKSSWK